MRTCSISPWNSSIPAILAVVFFFPTLGDSGEPISLRDLAALRSLGRPAISPDGRWVALTVTSIDDGGNDRTAEVRLISTHHGEVRSVGEGSSPLWAPDGRRLALRQKEGDDNGIAIYDLDSRDLRVITVVFNTDHFLGHRAQKNYAWSPDGRQIAFVGAESRHSESSNDVRVISRILYKTRTSFSDNRKTHVWIVPTDGSAAPRLLTPGRYDEHSLCWSPNGERLAFVSNRSRDPDDNYQDDLWTVEVESGKITRLTTTPGTEFSPAWSPDGARIAFLGNTRTLNTKDSSPENTNLFTLDPERPGNRAQGWTLGLDRRVRSFAWHPKGHEILFTADHQGTRPLYRLDLSRAPNAKDAIQRVTDGETQVGSFSLDDEGEWLAFVGSSSFLPNEVWLQGLKTTQSRPLTEFHAKFSDDVLIQRPAGFWCQSGDGTPLQGWLISPVNRDAGKRYPLILWVHGGPHGMYGASFSERFQLLAAHGYAVLYLNPRGSTGYGQKFADGCVLNWGGGDYEDLMAGLDHVLAANRWIDDERLGVAGGSYGGFMTNWIITRTNRFKCAVSIASVSNLISFYGTSLYQLLIEVEFNGKPWDNYPLLWQWSPLAHVKNVMTPTLFLHGEQDHDVPITQAEEMFIALKKRGVETVLVRYTEEGHGFRKPQSRLDYYRRTLEWFDRFLK